MGAAADWILAASPQTIMLVVLVFLVMPVTVIAIPRLAKRLQEAHGYAEVALKVVGFHFKISFSPERPPENRTAEVQAAPADAKDAVGSADSPQMGGASP